MPLTIQPPKKHAWSRLWLSPTEKSNFHCKFKWFWVWTTKKQDTSEPISNFSLFQNQCHVKATSVIKYPDLLSPQTLNFASALTFLFLIKEINDKKSSNYFPCSKQLTQWQTIFAGGFLRAPTESLLYSWAQWLFGYCMILSHSLVVSGVDLLQTDSVDHKLKALNPKRKRPPLLNFGKILMINPNIFLSGLKQNTHFLLHKRG